jgi:hypothetical protein
MKKAFKIYKEGVTNDWVTILLPVNEFNEFDKSLLVFKLEKYTFLGYQIKSI